MVLMFGFQLCSSFLMHRYKYKPATVFSPRMDSIMKNVSMVLAALIVCLGPGVGVIAAGMIFGKGFLLIWFVSSQVAQLLAEEEDCVNS